MSEFRGRVRKAPPIEWPTLDGAGVTRVFGGWFAEVVRDGYCQARRVFADQPSAFAGAVQMLRDPMSERSP